MTRRSPRPRRGEAEPFHAPFRDLSHLLRRGQPAIEPAPRAPPSRTEARATAPAPVADEDLFRAAMEGVRPLPARERVERARRSPPPPPSRRQLEDAEALARLADLCAGQGPFDIRDAGESIEGLAPGVDRRLLRRLRRGDFSVQAHLDLHGMTRDEARVAVDAFLAESRMRGLRCVLLIPGRGLNSRDNIPVLKQRLEAWLRRGKLGREVLAFASARPCDGGSGALYVLLRR